jgi:hypothetical protein
MDAHGHGTAETPSAHHVEEGNYRIEGLVFQMPGEWTVDVQIESGGESEGLSIEIDVE